MRPKGVPGRPARWVRRGNAKLSHPVGDETSIWSIRKSDALYTCHVFNSGTEYAVRVRRDGRLDHFWCWSTWREALAWAEDYRLRLTGEGLEDL